MPLPGPAPRPCRVDAARVALRGGVIPSVPLMPSVHTYLTTDLLHVGHDHRQHLWAFRASAVRRLLP
jgi:hypothetical protein